MVVRLGFSTELAGAVRDLEGAGARVESAGAGAITAVVTPESLGRVAGLDWVRAVEEPRALWPKPRPGA